MERSGRKTYWLLAATAICLTIGGSLLIPNSYANMRSEAVWQTGMQTAPVTVSSDYLAEGGKTVLLDALTQEKTISFDLSASQQSSNGTLSWSVKPESALSVQGPTTATATAEGTTVDLRLTPAGAAQNSDVVLSVSWKAASGQQMKGDFIFRTAAQNTDMPTAALNASLTAMEEFATGAATVITLTHPADTKQIALSLAGAEFPAGTSYTTEYSQAETVLYDPAQIWLSTDGRKQTVVLLKLPDSVQSKEITLQADVASDDAAVRLQTKIKKNGEFKALPSNYFYELSGDDAFSLPMPAGWGGCALSYTVQKLTATSGDIQYETLADAGRHLSVTGGAKEITVGLAGTDMQAGTYRLQLVWNYRTFTVAQQQVTFHISYPQRIAIATSGGNAQ